MLTTAQMIIDVHGGIFPSDYHQILSLKGIGPYTAAAIASFAFHLPYAVVDGNVYRVMSRFFGDDTPIDGQEGKKKFNALASQCLDRKVPHHYNQAIMDLGAVICKPENPLCTLCPLKKKCKAFLENNPERYPVKSKSKKLKKRYFIFFILYHGKKIALEKREKKDVWKHLYQFPMIELSSEAEWIMAKKNNFPWPTRDWELLSSGTTAKQLLSHQKIEGKLLIYKIPSSVKKPSEYFWIKPSELKNYPLPRLMHLLLEGEADKKLSSL
jgi:A/G-specific adenine glycosylase